MQIHWLYITWLYLLLSSFAAQSVGMRYLLPLFTTQSNDEPANDQSKRIMKIFWWPISSISIHLLWTGDSAFKKKKQETFFYFFCSFKIVILLSNSKYLSEIRKTMMLDFLPIFFFVFNQEYKDLYRTPLDIYTQLHNISTLYTSAHIHAVMHWISIEFPNHLYYISCQVVPRVTRDNLDWHPAERRTLFECLFSPNFFCLSIYSTEFKSVWFGDARNQVLNSLLLRLDVYI